MGSKTCHRNLQPGHRVSIISDSLKIVSGELLQIVKADEHAVESVRAGYFASRRKPNPGQDLFIVDFGDGVIDICLPQEVYTQPKNARNALNRSRLLPATLGMAA